MSEQKSSVGRIVHYVSYGTPKGEYPSVCRAAIITAVHENEFVDLCVVNPEGLFFNKGVPCLSEQHMQGGTWHWPERVKEGQQ